MAKQSLLVADADPRSLRILDVALRKAGFQVGTASDGAEALRRIQRTPPDLLLADVSLPGTDGVALCKAVRADPRLAATPVILISSSKEAALKLSAHEAGADDFLGKPLLIKELTTRIKMLLTRREQQKLSQRGAEGTLTGAIGEMGLVDLIQSLDANGRSALISCEENEHSASIWVRNGQVVDAEAGALSGEPAFYRVLGWEQGTFSAQFTSVEREAKIAQGTQALLAESVRRVDELGRLAEELPLTTVLSVDFPALSRRLADLPDEVNSVIRLCDGQRTIAQVMERAPLDELSVLAIFQRLLNERVLNRVQLTPALKAKPSLLQWLGPDSVATPAPPIMGAHGFPQSGDPTPIAPPVSDPPLLARPAASSRGNNDSPQLMFETPADPERSPVFDTPSDPIRAPNLDTTPADPVRAPSPNMHDTPSDPVRAPAQAFAFKPAPVIAAAPQKTDVFSLPSSQKLPVPLVRFAPLRGVRRERLRREADDARAQVAEGKPVRLTHVVELPQWPAGAPDPRRRISPAVGEAARKFAPDVPMGTPEGVSISPAEPEPLALLSPEPEPDDLPAPEPLQAPEPPLLVPVAKIALQHAAPEASLMLAQPVIDDRDQFVESATMQVEPLSAEALGSTSPEALATAALAVETPLAIVSKPALVAAPVDPLKLQLPGDAPAPAAEKSPWDESTDPLAAAPNIHDQITSPGHPVEAPAEGNPEASTSPGHPVADEAAASGENAPLSIGDSPAGSSEAAPVLQAAPSADASDSHGSSAAAEPAVHELSAEEKLAQLHANASAETAEISPLKPVKATSSDDDFDAEMRAALGKGPKRRWPLFAAIGAVIVVVLFIFFKQPPTDKKDSPWLEHPAGAAASASASSAAVAPAAAPPIAPAAAVDAGALAAASADAGIASPAADGGAAVAVETQANNPAANAAPADAGNASAAPASAPASDEYAKHLADGESLLKRGKYRPAVAELGKAVALNPDAIPALLELGDAWLESDKPRSALKPLEKAAKLDPHNSRAQLLLGTAWQSLGKTADAVRAYQRYLELDPSGEYARDVRSILANLQK